MLHPIDINIILLIIKMDEELIEQVHELLTQLNTKSEIKSSLNSLFSLIISKPKPALRKLKSETVQEIYSLFFNQLCYAFELSEKLCTLSLEIHNE